MLCLQLARLVLQKPQSLFVFLEEKTFNPIFPATSMFHMGTELYSAFLSSTEALLSHCL